MGAGRQGAKHRVDVLRRCDEDERNAPEPLVRPDALGEQASIEVRQPDGAHDEIGQRWRREDLRGSDGAGRLEHVVTGRKGLGEDGPLSIVAIDEEDGGPREGADPAHAGGHEGIARRCSSLRCRHSVENVGPKSELKSPA